MAFQATPYTLPLVVCGLAFAGFAAYLVRRKDDRLQNVRFTVPLLLATAVWMLGYAGELSVTSTDTQLLFAQVQYLGNVAAPTLWFAFVLSYVGYDTVVSRRQWAALAVPPVVTYALVLTYPANRLVWESTETVSTGGFLALETTHGPIFYVFMVYVYALVAASAWLLARRFFTGAAVYRRQTAGLLVGALVPAVAGLVYIFDGSPVPALNLPALAFVVTAGAVVWSVARNELFRLAPIAWETVVQEFDSPVFVLDDTGRVVTANPAGREFATAAVGEHARDALTPVLGKDCWQTAGQYECETTRGGDLRVFEVSVTPVERAESHLGHVVIVRDVTERHVREQRLAEFANVVSHDLRNPLNVAAGNLELGRETGDDAHFQETADALDRMERIIEDLLTLARDGRVERDPETVSLVDVAHTAWESVASTDANATLDVREDRSLAADETALLRLLENLFRNSVEHGSTSPRSKTHEDAVEHGSTSPGSQTRQDNAGTSSGEPSVAGAPEDAVERGGDGVTVTVGTTDDGFFVADDGSGIPEDEREQVFARGYTTSEDGTGFGLSIVEQVADAHGWDVELGESDSRGARFEFTVE